MTGIFGGLTEAEWDLLQKGLANSGDHSESMQQLSLKIYQDSPLKGCDKHSMSLTTGLCKNCRAQLMVIKVH